MRKRFLHRRDRRVDNYILPDTGFGAAEKGGPGGSTSMDTFDNERAPSLRKEPLAPPPMASYANQPLRQQYPAQGSSGRQARPPGGGQFVPPAMAYSGQMANYNGQTADFNGQTADFNGQMTDYNGAAPQMRGYNDAAPSMRGYNDPPMAMFQNQAPTRYNTPPPGAPYANYGAPTRTTSPASLGGYPARTVSPAQGGVPAALTPSHGSSGSVSFALVRNAFLPNLPDELAVGQGEMVRVLAEYDDGWALCANMRGEQGAVPLECLQRQRMSGHGASGSEGAVRSRDNQLAFV